MLLHALSSTIFMKKVEITNKWYPQTEGIHNDIFTQKKRFEIPKHKY